jgi:hypothetical protein
MGGGAGGMPSAPVSQEHHDGIARLHAVQLDDAVHGQIGVRVQLDKGVGAVGEMPLTVLNDVLS